MTFLDLAIPLLVCVTGLTVEGLKHDLDWYEHLLDDAVTPDALTRPSGLARLTNLASIVAEFLSSPEALREIILGGDPETGQLDVLD
ncbi:MAG: hypothetical protein QGG40_11115, partial [Myxococcota bacterium]|nr:hypothetical protein [Myxococcota bacterium]